AAGSGGRTRGALRGRIKLSPEGRLVAALAGAHAPAEAVSQGADPTSAEYPKVPQPQAGERERNTERAGQPEGRNPEPGRDLRHEPQHEQQDEQRNRSPAVEP